MKRLNEREFATPVGERSLCSIRAVMARAGDAVWQADAGGMVTNITVCRPSAGPAGELDETEIAQVEQLWRKSARLVERFSAIYHVIRPGAPNATFMIRAVPVLDERDAVLFWRGITAATDGFVEADTGFISEAAAVLSSSLNRVTIVNRLVQASIDRFCDLCAVHTFNDDGSLRIEGFADRRDDSNVLAHAFEEAIDATARARQPLLLAPGSHSSLGLENAQAMLAAADARSLIVVPLLVGQSCIGILSLAESQRATSYAMRDVDLAVIVARQLAMALENIKTFEREQRITERFRFLARVTGQLFTTLDQAGMLAFVLEQLMGDFADYGVAAALEEGRLRIAAAIGTKARLRDAAERQIIAALHERRSIFGRDGADVRRGERIKGGPLSESPPPQSWMMVPLLVGDTVFGALICCSNSHHYDLGELELLEEIGRRVSIALDHAESFARERRLIETLQQATLPTRLAPVKGATISAVYRPAALEVQVGGDWYDAFDLDDHRVLLTVGDVTGHGLEASIVMGKLRHAINVVAMYEPDPARILDAAERFLLRRFPVAVATAFVAVFDSRLRTLTYANAGHPYPILRCHDGSLHELQAEGVPIGLRSDARPGKSLNRRLDDAALLALYTDGLVEATRDIIAGERVLHEALRTQAVFYVQEPAKYLERLCLPDQPPDDVAILILNFVESQRWAYDSRDWRAARRTRREFLDALSHAAEQGSDLKAAELIFGELMANVAQHATGQVEFALEWAGGRAVLHVIDRDGDPSAPVEEASAEHVSEHARGLWLVQRLGAELKVESLPGYGTHTQATLPVRRTVSP
ncbi:MAG: SpoIIE family protein phosphatase [Candidatus Eremiobacteraeota bacterium]|nr:SpoIIE family protein phosphatase [Candidatus Eremiobacteraeota bacterium]